MSIQAEIALQVRSRDGFSFALEIAQIIHVAANNAPKVISRVGSMQNQLADGNARKDDRQPPPVGAACRSIRSN